jgi:hypothetical protein
MKASEGPGLIGSFSRHSRIGIFPSRFFASFADKLFLEVA